MKLFLIFVILISPAVGQNGFPKQFQAALNISGSYLTPILPPAVQHLLYDYTNMRVRFDVIGWREKQRETYMVMYKPKGAEPDSPPSKGTTMFNFNPDYPEKTKNNCWYRTDPMSDIGPYPYSWYTDGDKFQIQPWFPLPSNLINKGEEWIPEIQLNAVRYDSPEICDLRRSGIGPVPCLSYFEASDRPARTIQARAARGSYDTDEYIITTYLSFTPGISPSAESLFDLPPQWPSLCGNANAGYRLEPMQGYVVTPDGQDHFSLQIQSPPVHALGDQIQVNFNAKPNWYYNGTKCATFNSIVFNRDNWQTPQQVSMTFSDYGCCNYQITATGGGYDWQYTPTSFVVYACDGTPGYGCKGKEPCGA